MRPYANSHVAMRRAAAPAAPLRLAAAPRAAAIAALRLRSSAGQPRRRVLVQGGGKVYADPVKDVVKAFAPATVANLGPGYDWMGCAVQGEGDTVTAKVIPDAPGKIIIEAITGDDGRLSLVAEDNCIGIAAAETLRLIGQPSCGVSLTLEKGLPLGSGMGSSAASAAAAAWAVNGLFGSPLTKLQLIEAGLASEEAVSGYHADNVGPALLGGFVLIRSCKKGSSVELVQLPFEKADTLRFVLVNPKFEAPTKKMRAALPAETPMASMINNCCQGGSLVAGILMNDIAMLGSSLDSDIIIEPTRAPLIPGMLAVKAAAKAAGAYGCTISGAGPTAVAICDDAGVAEKVKEAMCEAFRSAGNLEINSAKVVKLDPVGAKFV